MESFEVFLIGAESFAFGPGATYVLLDNGALQVLDPENERQIHFGPAAWSRVEESGGEYHIERSAW